MLSSFFKGALEMNVESQAVHVESFFSFFSPFSVI